MFRLDADLRVYMQCKPIDFRAGMNTLVALVERTMQLDPFSRAVLVLHNRGRWIKLLLYDRSGFWPLMKPLEADHFVWPRQ